MTEASGGPELTLSKSHCPPPMHLSHLSRAIKLGGIFLLECSKLSQSKHILLWGGGRLANPVRVSTNSTSASKPTGPVLGLCPGCTLGPSQQDHQGDPRVHRICLQQLMVIKVSSAALTSLPPCRSVSLRILLPPSACLCPSRSLS